MDRIDPDRHFEQLAGHMGRVPGADRRRVDAAALQARWGPRPLRRVAGYAGSPGRDQLGGLPRIGQLYCGVEWAKQEQS